MPPEQPISTDWIIPLTSSEAVLALVGGKGANLARLARAGLPVPDGFLVTIHAYQDYVTTNHLDAPIQAALAETQTRDPATLEAVSARIHGWFGAGKFPEGLADALREAYQGLGQPPVAVRSSATAEDLPEMSFAGQQDTYLNVVGEDSLLHAVIDCWSSLWTARAIGYRARNSIAHTDIALAVVVQLMVDSQASGVLFTANPLSGLREETVIDAILGLGEALVSGQVEPDHYVVDASRRRIVSKNLGAKALSIRSRVAGGTQTLREAQKDHQAIPDEQILDLTGLGQRIAGLFGFPQDIEWAADGDTLHILQSRPITSLFPTPDGRPSDLLKVFFSFGAVQGMLDPITPLGRNTLGLLFATGAGMFGYRFTADTQTVLATAGERLWVNITPLMRNSLGRKVMHTALGLVEPTAQQAIEDIWDDPHLQPGKAGVRPRTALRLARGFAPLGFNLFLNLLAPNRRRDMILRNGEDILALTRSRSSAIQGDPKTRLVLQVDLFAETARKHLPRTLVLFISGVAAGMASFNILNELSGGLPAADPQPANGENPKRGWPDLVLQVSRGVPHNPTTEMDLSLWKTAQEIRRDSASYAAFNRYKVAEITALFCGGRMPPAAQDSIQRFLERYGGRGLGEIDLGRSRWQEDPTHVIEAIASYLHIDHESKAPDAVFERSAKTAHESIDRLAAAVRSTRLGWIKSHLVRWAARRARALLGIRESPKFFAVRLMGVLRQRLLEIGEELVKIGELGQPDDLVYLGLGELREFAAGSSKDWRALIAQRRLAYHRELLRRQIPRLLLSDGRAFYEGIRDSGQSGEAIQGSPVSPGQVEGVVRVVLDPRQANLQPGEILVCPGTDPSWTPLFLTAAGLVMEVGGMMTHGAVVAREYGIPAIVGVDRATLRLQTGQRVRVNGSTGQIILL